VPDSRLTPGACCHTDPVIAPAKMTLPAAQAIFLGDWRKAYRW
jgi:hypothetical protein